MYIEDVTHVRGERERERERKEREIKALLLSQGKSSKNIKMKEKWQNKDIQNN